MNGVFFACTIVFVSILLPSAYGQRKVSIVGCYSDLAVIEGEGLVVGTGSFRIKRNGGRYSAFFTELINDGGAYGPTVKLKHLRVSQPPRTVYFDIVLHNGSELSLRNVSGTITKRGIKMHWRHHVSLIGSEDPFLRRRWAHCE